MLDRMDISVKRRKMSLVMMFSLSDDDMLFVGDKANILKDQSGLVVNRTADLTKLVRYSGGVIGFAGKANLAQDMIRSMSALSDEKDIPLAIQDRLLIQYQRLTKQMTDETKKENVVEFLFSNGSDCMYTFRSDESFSPQLTYRWGAIGAVLFPAVISHLFTAPKSITLDQAKRLAVLQVLVTSEIDPTAVSRQVDLWLLRKGASEPEVLEDPVDVRGWVRQYRARAIEEFYKS